MEYRSIKEMINDLTSTNKRRKITIAIASLATIIASGIVLKLYNDFRSDVDNGRKSSFLFGLYTYNGNSDTIYFNDSTTPNKMINPTNKNTLTKNRLISNTKPDLKQEVKNSERVKNQNNGDNYGTMHIGDIVEEPKKFSDEFKINLYSFIKQIERDSSITCMELFYASGQSNIDAVNDLKDYLNGRGLSFNELNGSMTSKEIKGAYLEIDQLSRCLNIYIGQTVYP